MKMLRSISRKSKRRRIWIDILLVVVLLVLGMVLGFHRFSFSNRSHDLFAHRVQKVILHQEDILQLSKTDVLFQLDHWNHAGGFPSVAIPEEVMMYVFRGDSLVYWNNNLVEPRYLRKRVSLQTDTIVNLGNGDYLVSSDRYGAYSFYLFTLLNTTYPFENEFFVNRFQFVFGNHQLQFGVEEGYPVYNRSGQLLSRFSIGYPSPGASPNRGILLTCLMIGILCLYLLLWRFRPRWFRPSTRFLESSSGRWTLTALFLAFNGLAFWVFHLICEDLFAHQIFMPQSLKLDVPLLYLFLYLLGLFTVIFVAVRWFMRSIRSRTNPGEALVMVVWLVLFSLGLTVVYNVEYTRFENRSMEQLAKTLSEERDASFEASYPAFVDAMHNDTVFIDMIFSDDLMEEVLKDYLRNFMLDSVMQSYTMSVALCAAGQELLIEPYDMIVECEVYFNEKIHANSGEYLGRGLFSMDYNTLDPSYLAQMVITDSLKYRHLYLEFSKPITPQGFGLPKIMQHEHSVLPPDYSVACYKDSVLVYKVGSYIFPNYLADYNHAINAFSYGRRMKHYTYQSDTNKVVALCTGRRDWMELTAPFALFFFTLLLFYLLVSLLGGVRSPKPLSSTWRHKFQMTVLTALGISFLVMGPISVFFIRELYSQKVVDYHFERTRTLLLDITSEVDFSFLKRPGFKAELDDILRHYSETFFTDINIYGLDGKLLATTNEEITELRLQSTMMNAEAFHSMQGEKVLYFIHQERLGRVDYQSAYISIQDRTGTTLAYLNTPYFASQSELRSEILTYVLTYVNLILAVIFLILPLVLLLTRRFTSPLVQLQGKMRQVDINKKNELLEWRSNDEIGALISQYNQLVVELERSAAELRRTTTESAWRGVARQVAHEIKNSLTPMRLSVQMLQRNIENGHATPEQVQRTASTLIEQIDALSDIASSFSRYAKLPENHPQPLDLAELVGNVVNLYDNVENIVFRYDYDPTKDFTYNGDKTNLNSAVGNLVKNAVQAIGNKADGRIEVTLRSTEKAFVISVKDNGKGIREEDKSQIFLPNFTTKTGGSGVGLSLTYNIVQSAGGTIAFESEEGVGTEFVITLPRRS